jgi:hypothetical protein
MTASLKGVLLAAAILLGSNPQIVQAGSVIEEVVCIVADPHPPLNVRDRPNGRIRGKLNNGEGILAIGISSDQKWLYYFIPDGLNGIGPSEIGWVWLAYLKCSLD